MIGDREISLLKNNYFTAVSLAILLTVVFFLGLLIPNSPPNLIILYIILTIICFLIQELLILKFSALKFFDRKKISMQVLSALNLAFAFSIGFNIPFMESLSRYNYGFVMIPLLILLNLVLVQKYDKDSNRSTLVDEKIEWDRPIIEFEGKKFVFSNRSLLIFAIGAPISALLIYFFFDIEANYWLHELVIKQTVFFLNLLFNMGASSNYLPIGKYHWSFVIPGQSSIYFETFCTGIQAICVFAGIILFIPHSKDKGTSKDIIWRKTKALVISSAIFYVVNIIRMLIQIELYYIGYPWESIHVSISAASSFIAAIIILLLHKWIPEFIISIIYIGTLFKKFKDSRKDKDIKEKENK